MNGSYEYLVSELKNKNIRLSHQRLKVLEYMNDNRIHPTVDQIYIALHKEIPTLSKTTIYNTLNALVDAGLVKAVNIEDNELRYDIISNEHGHFKCESCGNVYDFQIKTEDLYSEDLNNYKINSKEVYFKGICPNCINK